MSRVVQECTHYCMPSAPQVPPPSPPPAGCMGCQYKQRLTAAPNPHDAFRSLFVVAHKVHSWHPQPVGACRGVAACIGACCRVAACIPTALSLGDMECGSCRYGCMGWCRRFEPMRLISMHISGRRSCRTSHPPAGPSSTTRTQPPPLQAHSHNNAMDSTPPFRVGLVLTL